MRDAQPLMLGETTAALDVRVGYEICRCFKELAQGKTAVLVLFGTAGALSTNGKLNRTVQVAQSWHNCLTIRILVVL